MANDKCTQGARLEQRAIDTERWVKIVEDRVVRVEQNLGRLPWILVGVVLNLVGTIIAIAMFWNGK